MVAPAPGVGEQAQGFRELCEKRRPLPPFEQYLTGLRGVSNKSRATIRRWLRESADKPTRSRFCSEAPWAQEQGNEQRLPARLEQTAAVRRKAASLGVIVDATLGEPVGRVWE